MISHTHPQPPLLFLSAAHQSPAAQRIGWTLILSFVLHLCILIAATGLRFMQHGERPLSSVQVSLVTAPLSPQSRVQEAVPSKQAATKPAPAAPIQKKAVPPAPAVALPPPVIRTATAGARRPSGDVMRDVMRDIELPPDAPQFGELSPMKSVAESSRSDTTKVVRSPEKSPKEVDPLLSKLDKLTVPEMASFVKPSREPVKVTEVQRPRSSLAEEINQEYERELRKELQKIPLASVKPVEPPKEIKPVVARTPPTVAAKVSNVKATDLKIPGMGPGSNPYLAKVQMRISSLWSAPPVEDTGRRFAVVIRFRLHRSGTVSAVVVEQSSGNEYYDLAGKRAVLNADPLPSFPPEMTDAYFDAHFTFMVDEQVG